jgi:HEAT repeat protein
MPLVRSIAAHRIASFRAAAAWIIRKTADHNLLPLLKPLLTDENPSVRKSAIERDWSFAWNTV